MINVNETTELVFSTQTGNIYEVAGGAIRKLVYGEKPHPWEKFVTFPSIWFDMPVQMTLESSRKEEVKIVTTSPVMGIELKEEN